MDALSSLLAGPQAREAHLLRMQMSPPWSLRIEDRAPLAVLVMIKGTAAIAPDGVDDPVFLQQGDAVVALGTNPYLVADRPGRAPQVLILPADRCVDLTGADVSERMSLGVRSWGNSSDPQSVMLIGTYQRPEAVSRRLLESLPGLLVLPAADQPQAFVDVLAAEMIKDEPGQTAVLDRLLDLLLIAVLRTWFTRHGESAPGWYRASADPQIGRVLGLIHDHPDRPWTVSSLAAEIGVSRAALARRFTAMVGESPMSYLTGWRLALAADLLREPDLTLEAIARRVGYGSAFALSTAFKREHGVSPRDYRTKAA